MIPKASRAVPRRRVATVGRSGDMAGEKRFVDTTIPPGTSQIRYKIQAVRSTKSGTAQTFPVSFGSDGSTGIVQFRVPASRTMIAA